MTKNNYEGNRRKAKDIYVHSQEINNQIEK